LGVADGVGGWGESGGDSSKVSVGMLEEMKTLVNGTKLPLSEIANLAFARMAASQVHIKGSTTLCTAIFDHEKGRLDISNVGDSGAYVIRAGRVVFKTQLGLVAFNAPHQVGFDHEGKPYGSIRQMETRHSMMMQPGDIILLATDGVLDNLYDQEIIGMVLAMVGPVADGTIKQKISHGVEWDRAFQERLKSAATTLAWHSWARSVEQHWKSPFAAGAHAVGYQYSGG
jgi:protein phosphatase PTC7